MPRDSMLDRAHRRMRSEKAPEAEPSVPSPISDRPPSAEEIQALLGQLEGRTHDDYLDDPFLDGAIEELAVNEESALHLRHVAAALLVHRAFPVKATSRTEDWRPALDALLPDDAPPIRLLLHHLGRTNFREAGIPQFALPEARSKSALPPGLMRVPPAAALVVTARDRLVECMGQTPHPYTGSPGSAYEGAEQDRWQVLLPRLTGGITDPEAWKATVGPEPLPKGPIDWGDGPGLSTLKLPGSIWRDADEVAAMAGLAIRATLNGGACVLSTTRRFLVPIGQGVLARISVRQHGDEDRPVQAWVHAHRFWDTWGEPPTKALTIAGPVSRGQERKRTGPPGAERTTTTWIYGHLPHGLVTDHRGRANL